MPKRVVRELLFDQLVCALSVAVKKKSQEAGMALTLLIALLCSCCLRVKKCLGERNEKVSLKKPSLDALMQSTNIIAALMLALTANIVVAQKRKMIPCFSEITRQNNSEKTPTCKCPRYIAGLTISLTDYFMLFYRIAMRAHFGVQAGQTKVNRQLNVLPMYLVLLWPIV